MTRLFVLICSFALVWTAGGATDSKKGTSHTKSSQHIATHTEHPTGGSAHVQHTQAPHHPATTNRHPQSGGAGTRSTGLKSHPGTAGSAAAKPAASAPPASVYHYNFRTKSGVIGRDFTRPLTPEEQTAIAREAEKGQPKGTQGAHGGDEAENGAYHYNFRTKSGVIGRDFTKPLTADEQSTIARQLEKGQPKGTQGADGGYDPGNGAYHYNFRTKSGVVGRDFARPLTADEQSAIARQVENGPTEGTPERQDGPSTKVSRRGPQQFKLPSKPNPAIVGAKFEGTGHIPGSETWTDPKYAAFRDYRHEWHDKDWWEHHCDHTHHNRPSVPIILVYGGWYRWHAGYWYPAWGYDRQNSYYPYDGPIYAYGGLAPDQVIANVQAALQAQGYYHGPINGLLDPATREAIANYQRDQGLYTTSTIDEVTLEALGMT
jgi:peptidoglycan hydrolase-like protein with peptidoglycan-binding domain